VLLWLAEAVKGVDGGLTVGTVDPGNRCPPLELGDFRCIRQCRSDTEQGIDVDAVVNRSVHRGHE
jgi:hypothetical protein